MSAIDVCNRRPRWDHATRWQAFIHAHAVAHFLLMSPKMSFAGTRRLPQHRIFVTGGNGFIGARVVSKLCAQGYDVLCLLRPTSDISRIAHLPIRTVAGDVTDVASLHVGMARADGCIHLASVSSWADIRSDKLETVIVRGTENIVAAARHAGGKRLLFVSSAAAINASTRPRLFDETSPFELHNSPLRYAIAKHHAERSVAAYARDGYAAVIVNPVEVYGPDDVRWVTAGNLRDILNDQITVVCNGGTGIAHVDDVADGIVCAYARGRSGERYILGGDNLTIEDLARLTLSIAGQRKPVVRLPNPLLKGLVNTMARLKLQTPVVPEVLDYATRYFFMDTSKARRELGYSPRPAHRVLEPVVTWLYATEQVRPRGRTARSRNHSRAWGGSP